MRARLASNLSRSRSKAGVGSCALCMRESIFSFNRGTNCTILDNSASSVSGQKYLLHGKKRKTRTDIERRLDRRRRAVPIRPPQDLARGRHDRWPERGAHDLESVSL